MEYSTSRSFPFEIHDISSGFQVAKGLFKLKKDSIELEYEVEDAILGIISSGVESANLSYEDLESIQYKKGWFSAKVILKATSMHVLEKVPGSEQATATLKVKRKNRKEAQSVVSKARMRFSEFRLDQLENGDTDE